MRTMLTLTAVITTITSAIMTLILTTPGQAQTDPNPAMNNPDKLSWTLFLQVNADAKTGSNNNALFETWASDGDTFKTTPA